MKLCIVTIVSGNYLAYARVLGKSLRIFVPNADFRVLVVDRPSAAIKTIAKETGLNITFATDLGLPDFDRIAYKYDIVELNTALKPTFLKHIFSEGFSHVIYLDPDIQLFSPLIPVFEAMEQASITLTPHILHPVLGDAPDIDCLRCGVFNLGFIALCDSKQTHDMLDWWESRCLGLGFNDTASGVYVDQKWVDLVPSYFASVNILRHPGCNVAYWNIHEREINWTGTHYTVNEEPLVFFHFSGVEADSSHELSKRRSKHRISPGTPLAELVEAYRKSLADADHCALTKLPYSFGALDDGTPITAHMRRALFCAGERESNPFSSSSPFQRRLLKLRITPNSKSWLNYKNISAYKFDQSQLRVRMLHAMVRISAKILGADRFYMLLRYAALLTRNTYYADVLMSKPLSLEQKLKR